MFWHFSAVFSIVQYDVSTIVKLFVFVLGSSGQLELPTIFSPIVIMAIFYRSYRWEQETNVLLFEVVGVEK